jgi:hypothetical protein
MGPRGAPTTCHNQHGTSRSYLDIQPPQSTNSYREVRYTKRGHTPSLQSWKTGFKTPRHSPTQVACEKPHPKSRSRAWDTNFGPKHPWNIKVLISTHLTSAAMALNMADMPNQGHGTWGGTYTTYMCRCCCPQCSALAVQPSRLAMNMHDDLSMHCALV